MLRYKYNIRVIKWSLTVFFLMFNIALIGGERKFQVLFGLIINGLAILVFIFFSFFPKRYYLITENGISYKKSNGDEIWYLKWENIIKMEYSGLGIIPIAVEIWYKEFLQEKYKVVHISYKQYKEIIELFALEDRVG